MLLLLAACGDNVTDRLAACRLAQAEGAATVQDRRAIGMAAPYVPDLGLAARDGELATSMAARREAAWQVVVARRSRRCRSASRCSPRLRRHRCRRGATWYARDDFERMFKHLYRDLDPGAAPARAPPIDGDRRLRSGTRTALDELPDWPEQRYLDYLAAMQTQDKAQGLGGVNRVGYSPGAMQPPARSYAQQYGVPHRRGRRIRSPPMRCSAGAPVVQSESRRGRECELARARTVRGAARCVR